MKTTARLNSPDRRRRPCDTWTGGLLVNCVSMISTVRTSPPMREIGGEVYDGLVRPVGVITMVTVCEVKLI